ncbi:hypothetical protein C1752_11501 [Acaryochloris thomasi RCC1774]|uniref:Uncharacterized protein n=1 Tax=Acaryochloris thomasi RCC1774 TaxID=1764569 RepID=A0A2W1J7S2_9CYAN|nr:hypothetical protein [Acaryochloris thomasi]PZD70499.1 hypothetical protein C1752_11501 [Acaryochloris thomasi RCC1774]
MVYLKPLIFIIILAFLSVLMCGVTSVLGANHPLFMIISMIGGMLGTLLLMDYIDAAFLH